MSLSNVIELFTGIALFLFGMSMMGDGLKQVAGNKLETILYKLTGSPVRGVLFGTVITTFIQSSSATSVMVVGFVNSRLMKVRQAVPVVLGAILGTSITGWVICLSELNGAQGWLMLFSSDTITCIAAVVGAVLRLFGSKRFHTQLGNILLGFAVLMCGMSTMSGAVVPLRESEVFINLLTTFSNPILGIAVGIAFTSIIQSASAAVGILQALTVTGTIYFETALPIIMGIAIGAAVPVLLSSVGASYDGKRTSFAYLISNVLGVVIVGILYYGIDAIVPLPFHGMKMDMVNTALLNSVYRFFVVAILMPFYKQIGKIAGWLLHSKKEHKEPAETLPLEERFLAHPALAIEQSRNAVIDMIRRSRATLMDAMPLVTSYSREKHEDVQAEESVVDGYEDRIGAYLVQVAANELEPIQARKVGKFLHALTDIERISDHAVNIAAEAQALYENKLTLSERAQKELHILERAVDEITDITVESFINNDHEQAMKISSLKAVIHTLCGELKLHHVERLQHGECGFLPGCIFNNILTSYSRIADHCSNVAMALMAIDSDSFDLHDYRTSMRKLNERSYAEHLKDYSAKYSL